MFVVDDVAAVGALRDPGLTPGHDVVVAGDGEVPLDAELQARASSGSVAAALQTGQPLAAAEDRGDGRTGACGDGHR